MARLLAGPTGGGYGGVRIVGDYIVGRQIGAGSFAVVWQATHRVHGTEVAVKEIAMERLSKKLQESLISEIAILKGIRHPNIIALHDIIEASGKIYLVLEYCRGGDLSMYIQRHGRVPEAIAKHFMLQLAAGLQVLRANNLIHRDLKPQNLLLSANDSNSVLKIADFGFARSLQPRLLAETLCGSPLYMAPEIMQLQKYDAKADLWSVGAILFQLVTGRTPFSGSNQIQLLQNIVKSNELCFPADSNLSYECIDLCQKLLRCNPVQRLTFEEFFTHQFLSQNCTDESLRGVADPESSPVRTSDGSSQDCLPFLLDESIGQCSSPQPESKASIRSTCGFSVNTRVDNIPADSTPNDTSGFDSLNKPETAGYVCDYQRPLGGSFKQTISSSKDSTVVDSLELVDQEYVLVPRPRLELSLSSVSVSRPSSSHYKSDSSPVEPQKFSELSALMPVTSAAISDKQAFGSMGSHISPASGTLQGSMDIKDIILQPSTNCMARIRSLQQCASVITELVKEEMENGRQLEAFSVQLVILAIWRQAMHSCHVHVASSTEGSPSLEIRTGESNSETANASKCFDSINSQLSDDLCLRIKREFLLEVVHAEELSRDMGQGDENKQMPDAIEIIFQSALLLGRLGAVDEMMKNMERAATRYSKAVCLLYFLLVEAPSLALNPPFLLTNSDRHRLLSYIDMISDRQGQIGDREGQSPENGLSSL